MGTCVSAYVMSLLVFISVFTTTESSAHIIMGTKSLHLLVAEADLVLRARVTDPETLFVSADGVTQRRLVEIEILERLKGKTSAKRIRIAQDGHDVARYATGEEALFFLRPIAKSRELRMLAVAGGPSHVSSQEHAEKFPVEGTYGPVLLSAVRKLAKSESAETKEERVALIRKATLELLVSGDPELGASGLASLVLAPHAAFITPSDLPALEKLLKSNDVSIGLRAGLIAELERRGLLDGPDHWLALLRTAPPEDLPVAIRVAGAHPSPRVSAILFQILEDTDSRPEIAAECAIALGTRGNVGAVTALSGALTRGEARVRNAAIRGLGRIDAPEAWKALEVAASTHSDPTTRRRAQAAVRAAESRRAR